VEDKIYASGTLIANEEVEIRNEIPGKVTAILFKEGTKVKKGDLLLTLYDDDLLAQLKKLELQQDILSKTEERQKDLLSIKGISQQEYDLSLNELNSLKADVELIQTNLSKTKIKAPFDGIIGLKTISSGAYIPVNTRITTIQAIDPIKLEFALPERYRSMISENTEIHFTTESAKGIFKGKTYAFEPKIDLQTRSVLVRAVCENKESKLFPGAFANIEIPLKKVEDAILIPTQALIPELKGQKVFVAKDGKANKVDVKTGMRNDSAIQIINGISEGDTVLITGIMQMRPGMPLRVTIKNHSLNSNSK
jgi:membrane fusion protein (multidrug efflux system)